MHSPFEMDVDRLVALAGKNKFWSKCNCISALAMAFVFCSSLAIGPLFGAGTSFDFMLFQISTLTMAGAAMAASLVFGFVSWTLALDASFALPRHAPSGWRTEALFSDLPPLLEEARRTGRQIIPGPAYNPFGPVFRLAPDGCEIVDDDH